MLLGQPARGTPFFACTLKCTNAGTNTPSKQKSLIRRLDGGLLPKVPKVLSEGLSFIYAKANPLLHFPMCR